MEQDKTLIGAIENRILLGISLYGPDAIPYNMNFLEKYNLKEIFFAYLDSKTGSGDIKILSKHIKECAAKYLPEKKDMGKYDRLILEEIKSKGLGCIDSLFPDKKTQKGKTDFLNEYNLLISYELYTVAEIQACSSRTEMIEKMAQININRTLASYPTDDKKPF